VGRMRLGCGKRGSAACDNAWSLCVDSMTRRTPAQRGRPSAAGGQRAVAMRVGIRADGWGRMRRVDDRDDVALNA
jgi:hypothetical protein